jgi:ACT domain-containing protein
LIKLIKSLYEIKVRDILQFNEGKNLERLMEIIDPVEKRKYELKKEINSDVRIEDFFNPSKINHYQDECLVKNVFCTISFQVVINNQPGTLNKLTHEIAKKHISICSIDIDVSSNEDKNVVRLSLGFVPDLDDISQKIESIQKFMRSLIALDYVHSAKQSSVER